MSRTNTLTGVSRTSERLSVNVSPTTAEALRQLADANSTTVTEIVRKAVAVLKMIDEIGADSEIQLVDKLTGKVQTLRLLI